MHDGLVTGPGRGRGRKHAIRLKLQGRTTTQVRTYGYRHVRDASAQTSVVAGLKRPDGRRARASGLGSPGAGTCDQAGSVACRRCWCLQPEVDGVEITMVLYLPRDSASVPVSRRVLDGCLQTLGVTPDTRADIALALSEACANVIQHAGPGEEYGVQVSRQERAVCHRGRQCRQRGRRARAGRQRDW